MNQLEEARGRQDTTAPGMLEVTVADGVPEDQALDAAVDTVRPAATTHNIGIMITRIDTNRFIVRAHPQVPNGLVRRRS
jgi:hypothetical protein